MLQQGNQNSCVYLHIFFAPGRTSLEENGVIKFANVTMEEEGTYICLAENVVGYRDFAALLTVTSTDFIIPILHSFIQ